MGEDQHISLGDFTDLSDGEMRPCRAGRVDVVVCRVAGQLYAVEDLCSHAESALSDGLLEGHVITCALHFASFDVRDGAHLGPPAFTSIQTFGISESASGDATVIVPADLSPDGEPALPPGMFRTR